MENLIHIETITISEHYATGDIYYRNHCFGNEYDVNNKIVTFLGYDRETFTYSKDWIVDDKEGDTGYFYFNILLKVD